MPKDPKSYLVDGEVLAMVWSALFEGANDELASVIRDTMIAQGCASSTATCSAVRKALSLVSSNSSNAIVLLFAALRLVFRIRAITPCNQPSSPFGRFFRGSYRVQNVEQ